MYWLMLVMNMVVKYSKKKIFEKRVLEVSKRVRFVILTLSKCSFKTHVYSLRYNEISVM